MSDYAILESPKYREAQVGLLLCTIFTQMLKELGAKMVLDEIEADRFSFNLAIRDEYRYRGGQKSVHGLGDYVKAAELWAERN